MYLKYYMNENGERLYTLKCQTPDGKPTISAHPARFTPMDKFSRERILIKKRFRLLPTQKQQKAV